MILDKQQVIEMVGDEVRGILHVGAHHGQEAGFYQEIGASHIVFFEAHPGNYAVLKQNLEHRADVTLVNLAVGDENAHGKKMYCETANAGQSNSLLKPSLHQSIYPHIIFDDAAQVSVEQVTLDHFLRDCFPAGGVGFNFLTMDVQGYELRVLEGATETLKGVRWIATEVNLREMYEGCCLVGEIIAFLGERGFQLHHMVDTGAGWGDAFFVWAT